MYFSGLSLFASPPTRSSCYIDVYSFRDTRSTAAQTLRNTRSALYLIWQVASLTESRVDVQNKTRKNNTTAYSLWRTKIKVFPSHFRSRPENGIPKRQCNALTIFFPYHSIQYYFEFNYLELTIPNYF